MIIRFFSLQTYSTYYPSISIFRIDLVLYKLSIISIDDIILSRYTDPMLTTIIIDKKEMGRIASNLLLKKIQDESVENAVIESDKLIIRGSTKII